MKKYISNAFSLAMLSGSYFRPEVYVTTEVEVRKLAEGAESGVGHADTAALFSEILGIPVAFNRTNLSLEPGDVLIVGQYKGPRLPEGATKLPPGASIVWWVCKL